MTDLLFAGAPEEPSDEPAEGFIGSTHPDATSRVKSRNDYREQSHRVRDLDLLHVRNCSRGGSEIKRSF